MIEHLINDQVLWSVILVAILCAILDFILGVLAAFRNGTFTTRKIAQFLGDHVLARVIPIVAASLFASALSTVVSGIKDAPAQLVAIPDGAWALAIGGLVAYAIETYTSLKDSFNTVMNPETDQPPKVIGPNDKFDPKA